MGPKIRLTTKDDDYLIIPLFRGFFDLPRWLFGILSINSIIPFGQILLSLREDFGWLHRHQLHGLCSWQSEGRTTWGGCFGFLPAWKTSFCIKYVFFGMCGAFLVIIKIYIHIHWMVHIYIYLEWYTSYMFRPNILNYCFKHLFWFTILSI